MENLVIQAILAGEAQADLEIRAAWEKALSLKESARVKAGALKEEAVRQVKTLLEEGRKAARLEAEEALSRCDREALEAGEALRERARDKKPLAAEAVLYLLSRKEEA